MTHGSFVLYGGGLGWRYASDSPERGPHTAARGSGSDSYLCTTVMGGRTPSYDFDPFDLRAVDARWLLGPVSRDLALSSFEAFDFEGSIHRQHAVFAGGEGGGGQVWVNRAPEPWTVAGGTLPKDGFYAETAGARAGIVELAGRRCAFSASGGTVFVDGRPDRNDGTGPADAANATALADFAPLGIKTDGAFRLERDGDRALLLTPIPDMGRPFRVELDLAALACPAATPLRDLQRFARPAATSLRGCDSVSAVEPLDPAPGAARPDWRQTGATLSLAVDAKSFAYRVSF